MHISSVSDLKKLPLSIESKVVALTPVKEEPEPLNPPVAVTDPVKLLANTPGVQIQQQTANTLNVEMRAGSGVFGTSTFLIKDNRYMVTPSAGLFLSYQQGLSNLDLATVEVVRGPAGVLYGPGVTSGVVHFRTKSPIDYEGNSMSVWAGEMATLGTELRIARANDDKTFGWKINGRLHFICEETTHSIKVT